MLKFSPDGEALFTQALPAHAQTAAINPFDGTLWVDVDMETTSGGSLAFGIPHRLLLPGAGTTC